MHPSCHGRAAGGPYRWSWDLAAGASLAGLSDLRVEAWRSDPTDPWRLDERHDAPFALAPVRYGGGTLTAEIVTTREPDVANWELVLTGVGSDGTRYVLSAGNGGSSTFTGSVWDWIVAVVDR